MRSLFRGIFVAAFLAVPVFLCWADLSLAGEISEEFVIIQSQVKKARDRVMPALVRVQPIIETFRGGRKVSRTGFGSGVIIGPAGYVMTNYHVAGKAKTCICVMANKEELPAKLIGGDPWTDIAIIQLDLKKYKGTTLTWASLGDSSQVEEGDFVLAMGSPFALTRTVTFGIVSCRDRSLGVMGIEAHQRTGQFNTWLQIDALINPGNSGGPLVDMEGRVIGINARGGAGMGFAVPINVASEAARQIIETGEVRRSWIGITFQPIEKFKKNFLGDIAKGGLLVSNVDDDSPGQKAGVQPGDIIIKIDGKAVSARFEEEIYPVAKRISDLPIGTRLSVEYVRKKVKHACRIVTEALEKEAGEEVEFKEWGFTAKDITKAMARDMRLQNRDGILITGTVDGSVLEKAKIGSGDILVEVDGKAVKDLKQFQDLYKGVLEGKKEKLIGRILRGGRTPKIVVIDQSSALKKGKEEKKPKKEEGF
ncbi:MAG: trypsin-like peptidase domain-containing protein [Planctomycetota bacterium]|jgi:serine protease Do